ncbi:MAG: methylenetetrahydrofolate reductase, partial [Gammaproteobacteria bacterium]|nr:methylenetetrahydrofolate reductase [Gammaproteobacteria bacterium]
MTDSAGPGNGGEARSLRLSFEFFPPRTAGGQDSLARVAARLGELQPDFYSCTYGAGGSTRDGTRDTITRLIQSGLSAAPHLSIGGDSRSETFSLLDYYRDIGVKRIV